MVPDRQAKRQSIQAAVNLAKNFPIFKRNKAKDAEFHVKSFKHYWNVAMVGNVHQAFDAVDSIKRDALLNTFKIKANK